MGAGEGVFEEEAEREAPAGAGVVLGVPVPVGERQLEEVSEG